MKLRELHARYPVLTRDELHRYLDQEYTQNNNSREMLLSYHLRRGNMIRIRRGIYATVPPGSDPETYPVDPYLIAAKSAPDAVLAYHTALELHGKAHAVFERFFYLSSKTRSNWAFRNHRFESLVFPKALRQKNKQLFATKTIDRQGIELRVTNLERTMVDLLDRPELGGGWEEVWRSLESVEYFDLDQVVEYVRLMNNKTLASKVGYYLEQHTEELMVENKHLEAVQKLRPRQPHYLQRDKGGKFIKTWNLVIPQQLAEQNWEDGV